MDEFIEASPQSSPVHFVSSNGMGIQFMPSDGASSGYYVSRYSRNLLVWHAALWATMKKYNISTNLIQVIKNLYNKATSAVLFNGSIGDWFRTTVAVRHGCLLSPTLFSIFLERTTTDT